MIGSEADHSSQFYLSPSVNRALEQVGMQEPICAATLAQAIFDLHGEYAAGHAASLRLRDTPLTRTAGEWLEEVQRLFDVIGNQAASKSEAPISQSPTLHGRLVVIGLSLLEPRLREQLESAGAFSALVKELREPLPEILTKRGRSLYESEKHTKPQAEVLDSVPNWPDDPLLQPDEDLLGRAAFARFLAKRIAAVPAESGAYSMHVYGPWGVGKSTLLNFLRTELQKQKAEGSEWLVVEFNAWRKQAKKYCALPYPIGTRPGSTTTTCSFSSTRNTPSTRRVSGFRTVWVRGCGEIGGNVCVLYDRAKCLALRFNYL